MYIYIYIYIHICIYIYICIDHIVDLYPSTKMGVVQESKHAKQRAQLVGLVQTAQGPGLDAVLHVLRRYHLLMTHSLPWRIPYKCWFIAGKIIYKWAIYTMAMLVITRG